jgi:hypothetical protein
MRIRLVVTALAVAAVSGCASSGSSAGTAGAARGGSRSQDVIAQEEINTRANDATNALQVVQKLRPQMLRSRGLVSPNDMTGAEALPRVYVDNVSYGGIDALSNVQVSQIKEIRFVNARDATTQWGTGHMGGVILVITKR